MSTGRLRLFYTDSSLAGEDSIRVEGEESAHLARSLRMQPGERCRIATERGDEYIAELKSVSPKETVAEIIEHLAPRPVPPLSITLGLPLIKGERFEWVLEKGTELGVDRFRPLALERCEVKIPANRIPARVERWRRIVREAAKQCDRVPPPTAEAPAPIGEFLRDTENFDLKLAAWLGEGREKIGKVLKEAAAEADKNPLTAALLLGPEGDLTPEEVAAARKSGFIPVDLGPRVLRADTAPIALAAVVQFALGDIGGLC